MDREFTKSSTRLCKFKLQTRKRFLKNPPDAYITKVLSSAYKYEPALMQDAPLDIRRNLNLILNIIAKKRDLYILQYVDPQLLKNKSAVKRLLTETKMPKVFDYADISMFETKAEVTELLAAYPSLYGKLEVKFREDKSIAEPYLKDPQLNSYIFPNLPVGLLHETEYLMPFITGVNISKYFDRWNSVAQPSDKNPFLQKPNLIRWLDQFGTKSVLPVLYDSMRRDEEIATHFVALCTDLRTLAAFTAVFVDSNNEVVIKDEAIKKVVLAKEIELFVEILNHMRDIDELARNYVDLTLNRYNHMLLLHEEMVKSPSLQSALAGRVSEIGTKDDISHVAEKFEERKVFYYRKAYSDNAIDFGRGYKKNRTGWLDYLGLDNFHSLEHFTEFKDHIMASDKFAKYDYSLLDALRIAEEKVRRHFHGDTRSKIKGRLAKKSERT